MPLININMFNVSGVAADTGGAAVSGSIDEFGLPGEFCGCSGNLVD